MMTFDFSRREEISLSELSNRIKDVITNSFRTTYWVRAETSDVRMNASGHCYLELVEKSKSSGQISAKIRAAIWASTYLKLKPFFERETGQAFKSDIKVLIKVTVTYHEIYGFSLNILDIDPAYTVGDMIRKRNEIIQRLKEEGVFTLNRELPYPTLPNRIAVITSETAAGYGDFINQLENNSGGYVFYCKLFPAIMQGEKAEQSIIAALERIFENVKNFDVVVIIRGGGATSELSCFDSYELALHCTQFPLPIITGIGHERDETVLDLVACQKQKTPTAVAEFLINSIGSEANKIEFLQQKTLSLSADLIHLENRRLQLLAVKLPSITMNKIEKNRIRLNTLNNKLPAICTSLINKRSNNLQNIQASIQSNIKKQIADKKHFFELTEQFIRMASPDYNLKRGYSLTLKNGKIIKRASDFVTGDEMTTRFIDGEINSRVQ